MEQLKYTQEDNFLDKRIFDVVVEDLEGAHFPWFFNKFINYNQNGDPEWDDPTLESFQFVHVFKTYDDKKIASRYFDIVKPILQKLNVKLLYRLKLNMTTGSAKLHESNLHVDVPDDCKTSVFYINTNNGYTKFEDGTKIYSKANRLITFNSQMKHCGTNTTDSKYRIVLNINYTN